VFEDKTLGKKFESKEEGVTKEDEDSVYSTILF
jgi:hypothetical protein